MAYNFDAFQEISVALPEKDVSTVTLKGLLDNFFAPLEDDLDCINKDCPNQGVLMIKETQIFRLPKILIIYVQRFSKKYDRQGREYREKIYTPLEIQESIDLAPYCKEGVEFTKNPHYDLYAMSMHSGTLKGGHYIAQVKYGDQWYNCNDSSISHISKPDLSNSTSYVLFYKQRG